MQPGTCLGDRYIVDEKIGGGEHGSVWFGRDTVLDRPVRIKVLDPDLARDEAVRARFRQTALAVASLDVPGVADVHDCVEERDGDDITVCQIGARVDGEPLRKLLFAQTFSAEDALALVAQVAGALHAAHLKGLRHLNLKSSNLIVGTDATVRIVDFGFQGPGEVYEDVSALGAIAYECLTGAKPFQVEPDAPPGEQERQPQPLPANIAPAVAVFVKRALSTDPAERFVTAARLAVECEQINYTNDVLGALLDRKSPEPEPDTPAAPEPVVGLGSQLEAALTPPAGSEPAEATKSMPVIADGSEPVGAESPVSAAGSAPATAAETESGDDTAAPVPGPRLREPSKPLAGPAPKPRRRRLVLVAVLLLLVAFAGTATAMTLLPGESTSTTDEGDGQGIAEPQDTSPITTGPPPSQGGDEAGNDPTESGSASDSDSPSSSDDDGDNDDSDEPDDNDGPDTVEVPDVVGDDPRSAYSELRDLGFEVKVNKSGKGDYACPVHQQSPSGGTTLDKGSTVEISVRMARDPDRCDGGDGGGGNDD